MIFLVKASNVYAWLLSRFFCFSESRSCVYARTILYNLRKTLCLPALNNFAKVMSSGDVGYNCGGGNAKRHPEKEGETGETSAEDNGTDGDSSKGADSSEKDTGEVQGTEGDGEIGKPSTTDPGTKSQSRRFPVLEIFLTLAVACIAVVIGCFLYRKMNGNLEPVQFFKNDVENLQLSFTNQTDRFWKKLRTRGMAHLGNKDPPRPLVLLLAAPPAAHEWVDCLATKLAEKLCPKHNTTPIRINGEVEKANPSETTKTTMDNWLKDEFEAGHKVALIHHLELLPASSPLLFHSYCDDQDAPYKDVAIIFTVHMPVELSPSLSPEEAEESVEDYLSGEVWAKVDKTAVAALLSRITDTVVLMNGESSGSAKDLCSESTHY